jgi:polar amino acid transport system substrate-binding protein
MHSSGRISSLWEAHYGAPMLREVSVTPWF